MNGFTSNLFYCGLRLCFEYSTTVIESINTEAYQREFSNYVNLCLDDQIETLDEISKGEIKVTNLSADYKGRAYEQIADDLYRILQVKKVIVYKLDRVSRSLIDFVDMLSEFRLTMLNLKTHRSALIHLHHMER